MTKKPQNAKEEPSHGVVEPLVGEIVEKTNQSKHSDMEKMSEKRSRSERQGSEVDRGAMILGGGLLLIGLLLLVGRILDIPFGDYIWPSIFIIPGALVLVVALSSNDAHGEGLTILGSILVSSGLVLLFQSVTGFWASLAYMWALVAPTSIGIGQMIYGAHRDREAIRQSGRRLVNLGLLIFAIGFVFFELILGVSGFGLSRFGVPVFPMILILVGAFILFRSLARKR